MESLTYTCKVPLYDAVFAVNVYPYYSIDAVSKVENHPLGKNNDKSLFSISARSPVYIV